MTEFRVDRVSIPKGKLTKEGYLYTTAAATTADVYEYINFDGTKRLELRHPDDIFKQDSLDTLKCIPVTNEHPNTLVNCDIVKDVIVGFTGESVNVDSDLVFVNFKITDKKTIEEIRSKKRPYISMGYTTELVREDGVYKGKPYTHRQKNIRYNHLAITDSPRAGTITQINFDSENELLKSASFNTSILTFREDSMQDEDYNKLSVRYDKLGEELDRERKLKEGLENSIKDLQSKLDVANATIDQQKLNLDSLKAERIDSLITEKANKKIDVMLKATKFVNMDSILNLSEREIMETVIAKFDSGKDLKSESDDYVRARFDAILDFEINSTNNLRKSLESVTTYRNDNSNRMSNNSNILVSSETLIEYQNNLYKK